MDANIPSEYLGPFQEALLEDGYLVRYAGHDPENSGKWRAIFKVLKGSRVLHTQILDMPFESQSMAVAAALETGVRAADQLRSMNQ